MVVFFLNSHIKPYLGSKICDKLPGQIVDVATICRWAQMQSIPFPSEVFVSVTLGVVQNMIFLAIPGNLGIDRGSWNLRNSQQLRLPLLSVTCSPATHTTLWTLPLCL